MLQDYAETTDTDGLIEEINTICKKKNLIVTIHYFVS